MYHTFSSTCRMGCGSSLDAMYDDPMPVVVFGATGVVGGAVARALLRDRRFEVKAVTRTPTTDVARKLAEEGKQHWTCVISNRGTWGEMQRRQETLLFSLRA